MPALHVASSLRTHRPLIAAVLFAALAVGAVVVGRPDHARARAERPTCAMGHGHGHGHRGYHQPPPVRHDDDDDCGAALSAHARARANNAPDHVSVPGPRDRALHSCLGR